jgi:hypothetical protein
MRSRKRWIDLGVEGVVIVASILLAFALDAWWDSRGQRQDEAQVLESLHSDFRAAGSQLDRYLIIHRATLGSTEEILSAARVAHSAGDAEVEVATVDLARTLIGPTFDARLGTLDGLLASGGLVILRSEDLRKRLSAWPGLLADAAEEEATSNTLIRSQMDPILWRQMDISPARVLPVQLANSACNNLLWGRSCDDINIEEDLPAQWASYSLLPSNFEVLGLFSTRLHILEHTIVQLQEVRDEIDLILKEIEEGLSR